MSIPKKGTTDLKGIDATTGTLIERKPKPGTGFEVPVFKDTPEIKPVVKAPLPPVIKPDVEKP